WRLVEAMLSLPEAAGDSWLLLEAAAADGPLCPDAQVHPRRRRLRTPSHHRWEQLALPAELAFQRLDLLHSPDYIPPLIRRCRSVITVHDLAFLRWPELLTPDSRAYFNGHIDRAVRSADHIIAVSQATKRDLVELLNAPAEKVAVIYEAAAFSPVIPTVMRSVEPSISHPLAEEDSELDARGDRRTHRDPADYVLFVGTLEPRKNLVRLIEAFAGVRRRGYDGVLLLAGRVGWLAEPVLEAIDQHSPFVRHISVDSSELPDLYRHARLLAFPSLYEGFGLPVLEAMACGTPVLTSNISSLPEIAADAALLVDPASVEEIEDGLWRLLTDPELANQLRAKGLARAAEFSWERAARQTLDVYHRVT
ncbi:MAG TPA: glycosyltransferase family 1 protein, partial [Chloroflexota bacterium]|nr:glycosyltransferase family 1 protein [Chloroflexota bacterium]